MFVFTCLYEIMFGVFLRFILPCVVFVVSSLGEVSLGKEILTSTFAWIDINTPLLIKHIFLLFFLFGVHTSVRELMFAFYFAGVTSTKAHWWYHWNTPFHLLVNWMNNIRDLDLIIEWRRNKNTIKIKIRVERAQSLCIPARDTVQPAASE